MDRKAVEQALTEGLEHITTWEDAFQWFDRNMQVAVAVHHPSVVYGVLFLMHAFLRAMRALPDEGNIQVLLRKMAAVFAETTVEGHAMQVAVVPSPAESVQPTEEQAAQAAKVFSELMASVRKPPAGT